MSAEYIRQILGNAGYYAATATTDIGYVVLEFGESLYVQVATQNPGYTYSDTVAFVRQYQGVLAANHIPSTYRDAPNRLAFATPVLYVELT